MPRLWSALAAICLLAVSGLAGAIAPAALASPRPNSAPVTQDNITIYQVNGGGSGFSSPLSVGLTAPTDITAVSAELIPVAGGSTIDAGTLSFVTGSGSLTGGTWETAAAVVAPPGAYTVSLSAADSGGDSFSNFAAGTVSYLIQPDITISADRSTADFDHQTVTFSGTVTGTWPDGSTGPLADQSLQISEQANGAPAPVTIHTLADGSYEYAMQIVPVYQTVDVFTEVVGTATVADTVSVDVPINVVQDTLQVTASPAAVTVSSGGQVTVTGTASYLPQGETAYVPAPGVAVEVERMGVTGNPAVSGTTASDGTYSLTFTPAASGTYEVYAGDLPEGSPAYPDAPYFTRGEAPVAVTIQNPVSFTSFEASIDASDQLTASVCVSPAAAATTAATTLQYATNAGGPWTSLGPLSALSSSPDCNLATAPGISMTAVLPVPVAAGYYRVSFPGASSYLPGTSSALFLTNSVTLADWQAKVSALAVLSASVCVVPGAAASQGLTVQYASTVKGPWQALGPMNSSASDTTCTAAGGEGIRLTASLPAQLPAAYYRVSFTGNTTMAPAVSSAVLAARIVTRITNLKVHPGKVRRGGKLTVSGRLWQYVRGWKAYGQRRVEIILEFAHKHKWYYIARPKSSRSGWFKATFVDPGSAHWAALYVGDATHYASTTKTIYVAVK